MKTEYIYVKSCSDCPHCKERHNYECGCEEMYCEKAEEWRYCVEDWEGVDYAYFYIDEYYENGTKHPGCRFKKGHKESIHEEYIWC